MGRPARTAVLAAMLVLVGSLTSCSTAPSISDYRRAANGPAANEDRATFAAAAQKSLDTLTTKLTWLSWSSSNLTQHCWNGDVAAFVGERHTREVKCSTRLLRTAGFDGDLADEITGFDAAARQAGWFATEDITSVIRGYQAQRGMPWGPNRTYSADELQPARYTSSPPPSRCRTANDGWSLSETWFEAGQPLPPAALPPSPTVADPDLLFRDDTGPDLPTTLPKALATRHYAVSIAVGTACSYEF